MHDVSVSRMGKMLRGIIEALWNHPDGRYAQDIIQLLPEIISLTNDETIFSPNNYMFEYERTARLATLPLIKIGWMAKTNKGLWLLTDVGRDACRRFQNPRELLLNAIQLSNESRKNTSEIIISLDMIQERAWDMVANFIMSRNKVEIRQLVIALLEAMQFHLSWIAHPQKDHGQIDMIANTDPIGAKPYRIIVHIKHAGQPVTVEGLKSFLAILGKNDFGLFFSTGGFTTEARREIATGSFQKINAMDLQKFYDLWIKHYDRLSRSVHQLLPLKAVFFVSPLE